VLTRRGVTRIRDDGVQTLSTDQGLPSSFMYSMSQDAQGDYWLTSGLGVSRIRREQLLAVLDGSAQRVEPELFTTRDGMATATAPIGWQRASCLAQDGRLWFATFRGVAWTDPAHLPRNAVVPPTYVESVSFDGRELDLTGEVSIGPGRGDVEFRYTGISFETPERMVFRYRLEGLEQTWREGSTRRSAYYAHLPPGPYQFRVQACNAGGVCNQIGALASFTLRPRFYETWPFALMVAVALVLLAVAAYRVRTHQLRERERELQTRVDEALAHVKTLSGLLPICSHCKRIRADDGGYVAIEAYIREHSSADFTHGYCPECAMQLFPDLHSGDDAG